MDYGNTATVTFENAPYGNLRVDKIDADSGASLAGATVEIKHIESGVTQTGTTDLGGSVYFDKLKPVHIRCARCLPPAAMSRTTRPTP